MLEKAPRDLLVHRIEPQREVGRQHRRADLLRRIMCVRNSAGAAAVLRSPLVGAGRALGQLPFVTKQVLEEFNAPPGGCAGPGYFEATGDGISRPTCTVTALPTEALCLEIAAFGLCANVRSRTRAVRLAEGVAASDQRDSLLVIHSHAAEGVTNVPCGSHRVRLALRAFRVHVDETHLHGCERIREV